MTPEDKAHAYYQAAIERWRRRNSAALERARREANMPDPLTRDDVLNAHDLLKNYEGDVHGLFDGSTKEPDRFTEWKLYATCPIHGEVTNTVSIPAYQTSPVAPHVVCPYCLTAGVRVYLKCSLVVKITWDD